MRVEDVEVGRGGFSVCFGCRLTLGKRTAPANVS